MEMTGSTLIFSVMKLLQYTYMLSMGSHCIIIGKA
jgi:hypothetical protein